MSFLFIDIETAKTTNPVVIDLVKSKVKHPATMSKAETIAKWEEEKRPEAEAEAIAKTSLNGLYGEIICIGFAVNNEPVESIYRTENTTEEELLLEFFGHINNEYGITFNPTFVGHNVAGFDLPFIYQRCFINNVEPTFYLPKFPKAWDKRVFDTLYQATGDFKTGGSLDALAKILGLDGKKGIDGSMVQGMYDNHQFEEIAEYCENDVSLTREIFKRLNFLDKVEV